ncbi:MAG: ribosome biogenesis GTPase YlqF [Ruminococcaceae bacterium]|nr:ribosome biogenesis GTPase YlqF [Oscillospiraceae bacterium]
MPSTTIQWFPGHMAKTKRQIRELLPEVDVVLELRDARIPQSSRNPEIRQLIGKKPRIVLLNKASVADPNKTKAWAEYIGETDAPCIITDCISGTGIKELVPKIKEVLSEKVERYESRGMQKTLRAMIVGVPNVGKSALINKLGGKKRAKVEDRPGVTRDKQWVFTDIGLDLLDTPGVLWPKFEDQTVGEHLAFTGAISDGILDSETIAVKLCGKLREMYPKMLYERYKIYENDRPEDLEDWELFELIGRKRGFLERGGEVNYERCASIVLDEFRAAKIGRITLDVLPR